MKHVTASLIVLFVIGLMIPSAFAENVPEWVKNTAGWWATDQILDSAFLQGIQYLIKEGIMVIPPTETSESTGSQVVPSWIKNNAGWWAEGQIDDSSFILGIQWLISNGIIVVEEKIIHTDEELRVAFIADQSLTPNAIAVLNLIKHEGADMVLHQGDFDYSDDPYKWDRQISDVLGSDFPYFASVGHHDRVALSGYQEKLYDRLKKNPDAVCNGDLGVKSSCTYRGLFFILVAPNLIGSDYDSFIKKQLNENHSDWRICSWHVDMYSAQNAVKANETEWDIYESCKNGGAIIATAHTHFYARSKTLIDFENQIVDPEWSEPTKLIVKEGSTFTFISGLGGKAVKAQKYCLPISYPYGCNEEWAIIHASDHGATFGALFCTFNVGGQPNKAYCYFKNIDGIIIDEFTITSFLDTNPKNNNLIDADMSGWDLTGDDFSNKVIMDTNLSNAILVGADLSNAVLAGTILKGADLTDANLAGVSLVYKDLTGTILRGADLTDANLTGVDLSGKDLTGTILTGTDLTDTNLTGVDLSGRDLTGTILRWADLSDTNLTGVDLSGRDLTGTILRGVDLTDKDLTGTILTEADLTNAVLPNDYLSGKNFQYTIFKGVDLSGMDLTESTFYLNNFVDANLENALFTGAHLIQVDFTKIKNKSLAGVDLSSASLAHSNLSGVNLSGTILIGTNFWSANLSGVDFTDIYFATSFGSIFIEADLSNSNFENVNLSTGKMYTEVFKNKAHLKDLSTEDLVENLFPEMHIMNKLLISGEVRGNDLIISYVIFNNFAKANLENANFKNADLEFVSFKKANLTNADLSETDLRSTFFTNADLSGADLTDIILDEDVFLNCKNHPRCLYGQ